MKILISTFTELKKENRRNAKEWVWVSGHNLELWRFSIWPECIPEKNRWRGNRECICISVLIVFIWTRKLIPWLFLQTALWFDWWNDLGSRKLNCFWIKLNWKLQSNWCGALGSEQSCSKIKLRNVYNVGIRSTDLSYSLAPLLLHCTACWCGHSYSKWH